MKIIFIISIIISGIVLNTAYADSSLTELRGTGVALLDNDSPKMFSSSFRILLHNQTSIESGYIIMSANSSIILIKLIPSQWQFNYFNDGSFHATGPTISRQGVPYNVVIDASKIITSKAGSLWKISGEISGDSQNYILELLVSGKDLLNKIGPSLTASIIIPNGNSAQSSAGFFIPLNSEIIRGTLVTWQNQDNIGHTIQSINEKGSTTPYFNSPVLKTGDTFTHKFNSPGVYHYNCSIHPWRIGVVTVS